MSNKIQSASKILGCNAGVRSPHKKKKCMSTENFWGTAHLHVGGNSMDAQQGSGTL